MKSLNRISTLSSELPTIDKVLFKGHQPSGLQSKYYESAPCDARKVQKPLKRKFIDTKNPKKETKTNNLNKNILVFRRTAHLCWRLEKKKFTCFHYLIRKYCSSHKRNPELKHKGKSLHEMFSDSEPQHPQLLLQISKDFCFSLSTERSLLNMTLDTCVASDMDIKYSHSLAMLCLS